MVDRDTRLRKPNERSTIIKSISKTVFVCAVFIPTLTFGGGYQFAAGVERKRVSSISYTLAFIDAEIGRVLAINNDGDVLVERQLVEFGSSVPLLIKKNGKETGPFECAGTTNDTEGKALNNRGEVVGHCGHQLGTTVVGFIGNPKAGGASLLAYPGAISTWAFGINDLGQVVGYYQNQPPVDCCFLRDTWSHGFLWDKASGEYRTIDNPLADTIRGGPTWLMGINNKGQIVGFYFGDNRVFFQVYSFVYDNGTFTPVEHPDAWEASTFIYGFNNNGQIFGEYNGPTCSNRCLFLYDSGKYFDVNLPLPLNSPRPDGVPAGTAFPGFIGGMNDRGQFVGTYYKIAEWAINEFGDLAPSQVEVGNFIATPQKSRRRKQGQPANLRKHKDKGQAYLLR
jgi:hypothetical protein